MTLEETLIKFGMEQKEAKIYLAALELGPSTVLQIAKRADIKRPTAYLILDDLASKGYISKSKHKNKQVFVAEKPEKLLRTLKAKEEILHEAMPMLEAMMATTKERPKIGVFEGFEGMKQVYADIYASPEIIFFGSIKDVNRHFPEVANKFQEVGRKKQTKVRDLLTNSPADLAYGRSAVGPTYEVRILPEGLDFAIDCAIYANKLAILAVKKDLFAVVIESKEVADSFRALHTLAWQSALPIEKILQSL